MKSRALGQGEAGSPVGLYIKGGVVVKLSSPHQTIGSGFSPVALPGSCALQVGRWRCQWRWLQLCSGWCWLHRAQGMMSPHIANDCLSGGLDILLRSSPHPAEGLEWCSYFLDALGARGFLFPVRHRPKCCEVVKRAQLCFKVISVIYAPQRDVLVTLQRKKNDARL